MKVIENNFKKTENINTAQKVKCTYCESILEYDNNDIITERRIDGKQYIICPCCNTTIILNDKSHTHIENNINNKLYSSCPRCGEMEFTRLQLTPDDIYACLSCGFELERRNK